MPDTIVDYRARAWAQFLVMLCLGSWPFWLVVAAVGWAMGIPGWCVAVFVASAGLQLGIPLLVRRTGSPYVGMMALGGLSFAGITLGAWIQGGFPTHVLVWTMALPAAVAAQRQYRSLVPIWAGLCLAQYVGFYLRAAPDHYPLVQADAMVASAVVLVCWLGLLVLISTSTSSVTYEFSDARDHYQRAVLQAQKLDALGKVAASIERRLNGALATMDRAVARLRATLTDERTGSVAVTELLGAVQRSRALSSKLERLGRPDVVVLGPLRIDRAVGQLERILRRLIGSDVRLRLDLAAPDAHVRCDALQLDQVLVNLVVNASDAMPSGGELTISTRVTSGHVRIEVRDTGTGIEPATLAHIFEPFFTTKGRDTGTGLGLWICRSVIESSHGTLTAESTPGTGTIMRVEFALVDPVDPSIVVETATPVDTGRHRIDASARWRVTTTGAMPVVRPSRVTRGLSWFVEGVHDRRSRAWGVVVVVISFATVPLWFGFGLWHVHLGERVAAVALFTCAALALAAPWLVRRTGSSSVGAYMIALSAYTTLAVVALSHGGFPVSRLAWAAFIPVAASLQREFRHLARSCGVAVVVLYGVVLCVALATGSQAAPVSAGVELTRLVVQLGMLLLIFRLSANVATRFAAERDGYETALRAAKEYEALGIHAGSIAHDLNNLLMVVTMSASELRYDLPEDHVGGACLDELEAPIGEIKGLARQLTTFGRTDGVAPGRVFVGQTVTGLERMLEGLIGGDVAIEIGPGAEGAAVVARTNALEQILVNLALNAREAMAADDTVAGTVTVKVEATVEHVTVAMTDTGAGIPAEELARVCEPFFTTDETRVGLGLWVCKEIAREAGGRLEISSEVSRGTTVRVILPRARAAARRSMPPTAPAVTAISL